MLADIKRLEASLEIFKREFMPYYKSLDMQVVETNRYVAIRRENRRAFSLEYSKLLQATCSEIDVFAKAVCDLANPNTKLNDLNISKWGFMLQKEFPQIEECSVSLVGYSDIRPWANWSYESFEDKRGRIRLRLRRGKTTPSWWKAYTNVKHARTTLQPGSSSNFIDACQGNVIDALAALFLLERLYLNELGKAELLRSQLFQAD